MAAAELAKIVVVVRDNNALFFRGTIEFRECDGTAALEMESEESRICSVVEKHLDAFVVALDASCDERLARVGVGTVSEEFFGEYRVAGRAEGDQLARFADEFEIVDEKASTVVVFDGERETQTEVEVDRGGISFDESAEAGDAVVGGGTRDAGERCETSSPEREIGSSSV